MILAISTIDFKARSERRPWERDCQARCPCSNEGEWHPSPRIACLRMASSASFFGWWTSCWFASDLAQLIPLEPVSVIPVISNKTQEKFQIPSDAKWVNLGARRLEQLALTSKLCIQTQYQGEAEHLIYACQEWFHLFVMYQQGKNSAGKMRSFIAHN